MAKKYAVVGLGLSGNAAVRLLKHFEPSAQSQNTRRVSRQEARLHRSARTPEAICSRDSYRVSGSSVEHTLDSKLWSRRRLHYQRARFGCKVSGKRKMFRRNGGRWVRAPLSR